MIGIVITSLHELLIDKNKILLKKISQRQHISVYGCMLFGSNLVVICSGVGKTNAAVATQILISEYKVSYIINIGYAGAIDDSLCQGDIVIGNNCIQYDFDATGFGYQEGQIPEFQNNNLSASFDKIWLDELFNNAKVGTILTGDVFVDSDVKLKRITTHFKGDCVDMEAAAIAQCALINSVPFIIVKCISDFAHSDSIKKYEEAEYKVDNFLKLIIEKIESIY